MKILSWITGVIIVGVSVYGFYELYLLLSYVIDRAGHGG